MADNHVCSFCNEDLKGKQHIKVVFENWPVEEEVTYRRKGKEKKTKRKLTKEVITAIGMECIQNPDRWKDFDIDPTKVADFFEDLRFVGKNPFFRAILTKDGPACLSAAGCPHFVPLGETSPSDGMCQNIARGQFEFYHLDRVYCAIGHQGIELVRQKGSGLLPEQGIGAWLRSLGTLWGLASPASKGSRGLSCYYFLWLFVGWYLPSLVMWVASLPISGLVVLAQRLKWQINLRQFSFPPPPQI